MPSPREGECDRSISYCQGLSRVSTAGSTQREAKRTHYNVDKSMHQKYQIRLNMNALFGGHVQPWRKENRLFSFLRGATKRLYCVFMAGYHNI